MKPVRILGQKYSMEILGATENPKSVTHLSDSLDIPIATCYRRVGELSTVGLLEEIPANKDGTSKAIRYRRTTDTVGIRFGPVPSLFAWTCVREAVGTDASALEVSTRNQTRSQAPSTPIGGSPPNTATTTERERSTGKDA